MFSALSWGQSQFDEAVEKATSELRLAEEDIALNLEICDLIRSKAVSPKDAARALRRRLTHRNPNVQLLALALTDVCVKNGGDHFLAEVAGKEFMDNMISLLTARDCNLDVRSRILRLVQNWATIFEGKHSLSYVAHVYKDLSHRGFDFPPKDPTIASYAMIDTSTAPEWIDSDVCMRCRTPFSFTNRKHHCRNCGQVFDQQCSARSMPLPHFGITQDVRVCDSCYTRLNTRREKKERSQSVDFHTGHNHHRSPRQRQRDSADADLQRAIQLSLAEASSRGSSAWQISEPPLVDHTTHPAKTTTNEEDDPELRAAIEASLREARAPRPSAPYPDLETDPIHEPPPLPVLPNHDLQPREEDAILTFSQTVQEGAATDLARVHALYDQASGLRPKLALSLDDAGRKEQLLGEMHEKLSHAVKLYDQLLTKQLAYPVWQRSAGAVPSRAGTWHGSYRAQPYRQDTYQAPHQEHAHVYHTQPDSYQSPQRLQRQQSPVVYRTRETYQLQAEPSQVYSSPQPSQPHQEMESSQVYQKHHASQAYEPSQVYPHSHSYQLPESSQKHQVSQTYEGQKETDASYPQQGIPAPGPSYHNQTWSAPQPPPAQYHPTPPTVTPSVPVQSSFTRAPLSYIQSPPPAHPAVQSSPPPQSHVIQSPPQQHAIRSPPPPQPHAIHSSPHAIHPPSHAQFYAPIFPTAPTSDPLYTPYAEKKEVALIEL